MVYIKKYEDIDHARFIDDTAGDDEIKYIIGDCLIDLKQEGMNITYQMQRKNNIVLIYVTGKKLAPLSQRDFSFSDIKDPVNHLISMMFSIGHPLTTLRYRYFDTWRPLFEDPDGITEVIDPFDNKVKSDISSFEIKFKLDPNKSSNS